MYKFILSTDSCCDENKAALKRDDISYIAMPYIINDNQYFDNFSNADEYKYFYDEMRRGRLSSTASLSLGELEEYFENLINTYHQDILHFALDSGLSVTYDNTVKAANSIMEKYPQYHIYIPDVKAVTQGQNYLLQIAKDLRNQGKSAEATMEFVMEKAPYLHHFFFITDLMHLKRGGRISSATAAVGTLLKARLVCTVLEDGKLSVIDKAMGTKKALKCLVDNLEDFGEDLSNQTIYICHSDDFHNAELLKAFVIKQIPRAKIIINNIGPVIGSHTGPDTIGIVFLGKHRSKLVKSKKNKEENKD